MGAICHVTPVLNDILDLCRFDLTYLTPPQLKFHGCNLSCYTCVKWYFRSMQIWLDVFDPPNKISQDAFHHITPQPFNQSASSRSSHNKNHVLPKRSTMLKSISCFKLILSFIVLLRPFSTSGLKKDFDTYELFCNCEAEIKSFCASFEITWTI